MLKELRSHLSAGRYAQAVEIAEILLAQAPENIDALHLGAIAHARMGHAQQAQDLFERALLVAPEDPILHMNFAQLHLAKGDLARAKGGYKAASMLNPNLSVAHSSLGNIAAIGGDVSGAEELYLTALRADPNSLPALLGHGHLLLDRGDLTTAQTVARQAAKVAPQDARAQALIGRAFLDAGHTDFAIQAFQNAVKIKPQFFAARVMLARALMLRGDLQGAETELTLAAQTAPSDITLKLVRAELYTKTLRHQLAANDLDEILTVTPLITALRARVGLYFSNGELNAGLELLKSACLDRPTDWLLNHALLGYLLDFGRSAEARAEALSWTERAPKFAPAWMHLASIDEGQGEFDGARDAAEIAIGLDPDLAQVKLILARARLRAGRPGDAQTYLNSLLAKNCTSEQRVEAMGLRGRALDALGQRNEAVISWQEAAALKPDALRANDPTLPRLSKVVALAAARSELPPLSIPENQAPQVIFLTGLPMSGVESIAWWLAHAPQTIVLNDRFSVATPAARQDFLNTVGEDRLEINFTASELEHVRSRYFKALRRALGKTAASVKLVVDWLPVLDIRQYRALSRALPDARWLHVERDSRDVLLGALMTGSNMLPIHRLNDAALLLGEHAAHLTAVAKEHSAQEFRFAFGSAKGEHTRLGEWLQSLGLQGASEERWAMANLSLGGLPAYFPAKRWQAFETSLKLAFGAL